jgi:SAM-dependent methyltransferase
MPSTFYQATYGHFTASVLRQIRAETYSEDIGQNSWLTAAELASFSSWLGLSPRSVVLDVGSGSGGPALCLARLPGCTVTGVEASKDGAAAANEAAHRQGLAGRAIFLAADASQTLPLDEASFTAVVCIDTMNHLPGRLRVLQDWHRLLVPGGRILYTDPLVLTGLVSSQEVALRSAVGYSQFGPPGENERLIAQAGFRLLRREDATANVAAVSKRWHEARARHRAQLAQIEGETEFEATQKGMAVVHQLAAERRLSRTVFVAEKSR